MFVLSASLTHTVFGNNLLEFLLWFHLFFFIFFLSFFSSILQHLQLDLNNLGGCAMRTRTFAKALHYKELEFRTNPS